jgi:hypothetical protein
MENVVKLTNDLGFIIVFKINDKINLKRSMFEFTYVKIPYLVF